VIINGLNTCKINNLGWYPMIDLKKGLIKTIKEVDNIFKNEIK
jgi:dTDP-D-glucose 4,6-dehydratase